MTPLGELEDVLRELEVLLKNPDVGAALAEKGVNTSLAMVALDGLRAYLDGNKVAAVDELEAFLEEVRSRLAMGSPSN